MLGSLHEITAQQDRAVLFSELHPLHKRRAKSRAQSGQRCSALHLLLAVSWGDFFQQLSCGSVLWNGDRLCSELGKGMVCPGTARVHLLVSHEAVGHWSSMTSPGVNDSRNFCLGQKKHILIILLYWVIRQLLISSPFYLRVLHDCQQIRYQKMWGFGLS